MKIEVRGDSVLIEGYVNTVLRDSKPIPSRSGKFIEQIMPKAFQRALERNADVKVLLNHDKTRELSSTQRGFELYEDNIGLHARGTINDSEVVEKAKNKQLTGWSFGFIPIKERVEAAVEGIEKRFVDELDLLEVSILDNRTSPAYIACSIEARDGEAVVKEYRNGEEEFEISITPAETPQYDNTAFKTRIDALKI